MRRKDRECTDENTILQILDRADTLFLAVETDSYPYCVPVNFTRKGSVLYIHSALKGSKLDWIRRKNDIGFSAAIDIEIDINNSTTYYKSVCGNGKALIIEDEAEKGLALDLIAKKYNARCSQPAPLADIHRVGIIRIDIESLTGKISSPRQPG